MPQYLQSGSARQAEIQNNGIVGLFLPQELAILPVRRMVDGETARIQIPAQGGCQVQVIVHQQQAHQ